MEILLPWSALLPPAGVALGLRCPSPASVCFSLQWVDASLETTLSMNGLGGSQLSRLLPPHHAWPTRAFIRGLSVPPCRGGEGEAGEDEAARPQAVQAGARLPSRRLRQGRVGRAGQGGSRTTVSLRLQSCGLGPVIALLLSPLPGFLDWVPKKMQRVGCVELLNTVQRRVQPRLHVFGHIHEGQRGWGPYLQGAGRLIGPSGGLSHLP